jgi:hypothetical protein
MNTPTARPRRITLRSITGTLASALALSVVLVSSSLAAIRAYEIVAYSYKHGHRDGKLANQPVSLAPPAAG